jgi:hypothetical protein
MTILLDCTASEAMTSPHLFGSFFRGKSWDAWFATVKGTFGEPMPDGDERALPDVSRLLSALGSWFALSGVAVARIPLSHS